MPVPPKMELVLDGDMMEKHSITQGNYTLGEGLVNGLPYWYQQDGKHAIWSYWSSRWMVGQKKDLGKTSGYIFVKMDSIVWPTQVLDGFRYTSLGTWQYASLNEVVLKDCKFKRASFGRSNTKSCVCTNSFVQKSGLKIQANKPMICVEHNCIS